MEIHWRGMEELADEERGAIEARLRGLDEGHGDLIDLWITGTKTSHHRHGGQEVRLRCQARGRELVAARTRPDLGKALDEVLDLFEREVRKLRDKRSDLRALEETTPAQLGVIDRIFPERGYGFILTDGGEQVYFHRNALHGGLAFERLEDGDRVGLDYEAGDEGLQATVVRPAPPGTPSP